MVMKSFKSVAASAAVAVGLAIGLGATAALAEDNVHVGVDGSGAEPTVIFVFSDGAQTGFAPIDAFSITLDQSNECAVNFDADWNAISAGPEEPIYGPASPRRFGDAQDQTTIDVDKLPTYFAREAVAVLLAQGLVESERAAVPYFNCAGLVWATVLSQTPDQAQQ